MPVIAMEVAKISKEQKKDLVKRFTEVASDVTGIDKQYIMVIIRDWPDENIGIDGQTVEEIKFKFEN
jgi:4-oxalocrotonate tautomerase